MNYNGTSWGTVVKSGFSASQADDVTLALDSSNKPYVAYKDYGNGNKATVMTTGAAPLHDIDVQGKDSSITNGSTTPGDINDTDFGPADVASGATVDHTFTIYNPGSEVLTLSDTPPVAISGPNAAEFSVTTQPTSPVASGGNTTFTVHFAPVTCGVRSATISITTNVPGKNPFTFAIQGKGTATGANYVDQNCPPPGNTHDGKSWATAWLDLAPVLEGATGTCTIYVAQGTYKPTTGTDRAQTFQLVNGVAVYGGYPTGGPNSARAPGKYTTTLSGEIGDEGNSDNTYYVVSANSIVNNTAILDGFTITGGNARWAPRSPTAGGFTMPKETPW